MTMRVHRWSKRLLLTIAALPVCQLAGGCDPTLNTFFWGLANSTYSLFVGSAQQVLLQSFPSADILQVLLGGAPPPPLFAG